MSNRFLRVPSSSRSHSHEPLADWLRRMHATARKGDRDEVLQALREMESYQRAGRLGSSMSASISRLIAAAKRRMDDG